MEKIKMGVCGLGCRGDAMISTFLATDDFEIIAVCDEYEDRQEKAAKKIKELKGYEPVKYTDYKEMFKNPDIKVVYIASSWESHIAIAIDCMKAGIITAMEVGGAYTLKECYELVKTYEKTKTPFTMLENCCYDKFELLSTALVRSGLLGEVVHCHGAYSHDLREEVAGGNINRHYRLRNYISRNCENYPTHELGPIAKLLNINRGNRMLSLVSVASKAAGLKDYINAGKCNDESLKDVTFNQGDIVNTIITCSNGETISMTLDTTLPKYYSREFTVRGTRGMTNQDGNLVFIDGDGNDLHQYFEPVDTMKNFLNNGDNYSEYLPDYWKNITEEEKELGHGGMDYYMLKEFAKAIRSDCKFGIDVYDAASWMAITPLSAKSIKGKGKPVKIPDFTNGEWKVRKSEDVVKLGK